ncbi:MAG TPA: serine/threonine protein phosphatase, partial [Ruminococcaceae bacterium]|nr:serine/threonine protein phosphatase [Oscillospiraceae bacterium]
MNGFDEPFDIEWENISLQDELDLAAARLKNAQAAKIEREIG